MSITTQIDGLNAELVSVGIATEIDGLNLNLVTQPEEPDRFTDVVASLNGSGELVITFTDTADPLPEGYAIRLYDNSQLTNGTRRVTESGSVNFGAKSAGTYWFTITAGVSATVDPAPDPTPTWDSIGEGSQALDEQALNDLYAATQGQGIEVLASEADLPAINGDTRQFIEVPQVYMINGNLYYVDPSPGLEQWVNRGAPWKRQEGWNNGDVTLQVGGYEDAPVGVKVEELTINGVTELRVTGIDFQKLNYSAYQNITAGNNLAGTIPESIGYLRQLQDRLNLKQNFLHGDIPASMYTFPKLKRWSVGGQSCELDLDRLTEWYEGTHSRSYDCLTTQNITGKQFEHSNRLSGVIPDHVNLMQSLELFEARRQELKGTIPQGLVSIPSLRAIFMEDQNGSYSESLPIEDRALGGNLPSDWSAMVNLERLFISTGARYTESYYTGEFPESLNQLPKISHITIVRHKLTGNAPTFPNVTYLNYYNVGGNDFNQFPLELLRPNTVNLSKFGVADCGMTGTIGDLIEPYSPNFASFSLSYNNFTGPLPQWIKDLRLQITHIINAGFSGEAPWEHQNSICKTFYVDYNNFSGRIKARPWADPKFEGTVLGVVNSNTLQLSFDTSPILTGTITYSDSGSIKNDNATHLQEWSGAVRVRIIVPDGEDIVFTPTVYYDGNWLWSPSDVDTSGTTGLTYEVTIPFENQVIGIEDPLVPGYDDRARHIISVNGNQFTFDRDITAQVGEVVRLYQSSRIGYCYMNNNQFIGPIPEAHAYSPTTYPGRPHYSDNNFGWDENQNIIDFKVPDFTNMGKYAVGQCVSLTIDRNRLLPYHILDNHTANQTIGTYRFGNQKPFSPDKIFDVTSGQGVMIDLSFIAQFIHPNDSIQWRKDGSPITSSGDGRVVVNDYSVEINGATESDSAVYTFIITNSSLPGMEFKSGDHTVTVDTTN